MRVLILSLVMMLTSFSALAVQSPSVDTGRVTASLISSHDRVLPGNKFYIALQTKLDKKWHTYWRNPGDSGEPVDIEWVLPPGITASGINWIPPKVIQTGPIVNYGYEGSPLFPVQFTVSEDVKLDSVITIIGNFYYLVCKDICIPENGSLSLSISIGPTLVDLLQAAKIEASLSKVPKKGNIEGVFNIIDDKVKMEFKNFSQGKISSAYFYPYENDILINNAEQSATKSNTGLILTTISSASSKDIIPEKVIGALTYSLDGKDKSEEVELVPQVIISNQKIQPGQNSLSLSFLSAFLGAFLGGIILNFMPCVFPVISMKALAIAKLAHGEKTAVRRDALMYSFGVMITFLFLAIAIILVKSSGAKIGWGFHLQSPEVVSVLAIVFFLAGLSLLGLFEINSFLQNFSGRVLERYKMTNSFFTGAFAVIVATPCTAPFMAGALGYAFVASSAITATILISLGAGFASPFLLLAYFPHMVSRLPKPGLWMIHFKEALSFPMFAASIWLVWVLNQQVGSDGTAKILISFLLFVIAIWFMKNDIIFKKLFVPILLLIAFLLPLSGNNDALNKGAFYNSYAEEWSLKRVAELNKEGRKIFVDFTAAWCVTCKYNEKIILNDPRVKRLFQDTNTAFLIADWTNKNSIIANELNKHGRAGIPLYLVYDGISIKPKILPQTLNYKVIKTAIYE